METPLEIERKFIIYKPSIAELSLYPGYSESEICQIYLDSESGTTHRVRKRVFSDRTEYTETKKQRINEISSYEDEREITEARFSELSEKIKEGTSPVIKKRYTVRYLGRTFEIDVYPEWQSFAIMEIELEKASEKIEFPPEIKIKREVSGIRAYSNAMMAKSFPKEDTDPHL